VNSRRRVQPFEVQLTPGYLDESGVIFGWDFQRSGQQPSELPGWAALSRFDFPESEYRTTSALCQLVLGQVEFLAPVLKPFTESEREIHRNYGKQALLVAYPDLVVSMN